MKQKKTISLMLKVFLPFLLAVAILCWMYRGFDWNKVFLALSGEMSWTWMLLTVPFGVMAQVFRAFRWKQLLAPVDEHPRIGTCVNAVFVSYASSLLVPRIGEFLRCGVLKRYEGTCFSRSVGTVVTERVVDTLLVLLLAFVTMLIQIPVFLVFFKRTGVSMDSVMRGFSFTGYVVTAVCLVLAAIAVAGIIKRLGIFSKTKAVVSDLCDGLLSIRRVKRPLLFLFYSLAIWVCYFLHFYLAFFCFDYTCALGPMAALVAFVVGTFAVLVPTPNGAGPWHFAVKTVLVLYGVGQTDGAVFVLIVHTLQTILILLLGLYAMISLSFTKRTMSSGT